MSYIAPNSSTAEMTLSTQGRSFRSTTASILIIILIGTALMSTKTHAWTMTMSSSSSSLLPQGCASRPALKQKIAVVASGGYMGAMTFGFLQRSSSLFGTGMGACRCIGATADTSRRLNSYLSRHFCLAMADESLVKLTNMTDIDAIVNRINGYNALIVGTDLGLARLPVTANTYERTPNDMAWELYWDPHGTLVEDPSWNMHKKQILQNILAASQKAGLQHVVVVDDSRDETNILQYLKQTGVPYTYIKPQGDLVRIPEYTFQKGIQGKMAITALADSSSSTDTLSSSVGQISKEDLAALAVQVLQSLDWTQSRCLQVTGLGPFLQDDGVKNPKRAHQEWVVDSYRLAEMLKSIQN